MSELYSDNYDDPKRFPRIIRSLLWFFGIILGIVGILGLAAGWMYFVWLFPNFILTATGIFILCLFVGIFAYDASR